MGHLGGERIALDPDGELHVAARPDSDAPAAESPQWAPADMTTVTLVVSGLRPSWR